MVGPKLEELPVFIVSEVLYTSTVIVLCCCVGIHIGRESRWI